jgi:hypothetical protein
MTSKVDDTFALVEDTFTNIYKTADLIENLLGYLISTDLQTISVEIKDELSAKLHTALIILQSIDDQVLDIIPQMKFSTAWEVNINGILQFLDDLPSSRQNNSK